MQSREFMISAKVLTGLTKVHSTSQEENFQEKRSFLRTITTFGIFFGLRAISFLILVWKPSIGLWTLHFTCPEEISRIFWENFLIVSSFLGLELKSQFFLIFGQTISATLSNDLLQSRGNVRGKMFFFRRRSIPFSSFKLWAEIYGCLGENYRMVVRFHLYMFGGSFGENHIFEKL